MEDNVLFGEHYNTHFDPDVYVKSFFTVLEDTVEGGLAAFILKGLQDVFKSGDVKGTRLLDIGTGPIPHSVIPAVPFVQDIYLTDFSTVNRKYLQDALFGSGKQDYENVYDFFANLGDKSESWRKRSDDLKAKVCGIFPCDLLQDDIFGGSSFPLFDVITSSLCIEAAAPDVETYGNIAKKISKYLKVGGHLVIVGVLGQNYYIVGEHKFFSVSISEHELKSCWEQAGCTIQGWNHLKGSEETEYADLGSVFVMDCVKKS
ncbi:nicotinamide N-methyltransferase [Patella vulgata]|uniref:nicotinamide N-methyltransferase n=1 Tax=Patella vulgata TaxID=6465 RepID=UPI0024A8E140|nr:nicotinamide N-methyltransferase [Patella vulgata]